VQRRESRSRRAQQLSMSVIGFLGIDSPGPLPELLVAFHRGLKESRSDGATIEYWWAEGNLE
jgi:hypothetical protein